MLTRNGKVSRVKMKMLKECYDGLICNSDQLAPAPRFFSSPGWQFEYCLKRDSSF